MPQDPRLIHLHPGLAAKSRNIDDKSATVVQHPSFSCWKTNCKGFGLAGARVWPSLAFTERPFQSNSEYPPAVHWRCQAAATTTPRAPNGIMLTVLLCPWHMILTWGFSSLVFLPRLQLVSAPSVGVGFHSESRAVCGTPMKSGHQREQTFTSSTS